MNCPACGNENRDTAKFCGACAAPLVRAVACSACGTANSPGQTFCDECGASLKQIRNPKFEIRNPEGPRSYTPRHLADKILQSKSALAGERKQVTVLFADVKGSMELAEQMDPEEWSRIMQRFFRMLSDGVERFEGFVDKFTGDGIMALFGAPIAHEDHAQRACYAALHLRDEIRGYADELRRTQGLSFSVRIGLNSGEVVVGNIGARGDDLRMEYTAQGHTVGLAQRMESRAAADSTYLTAHTARLVEGYFQLRDLGEFDLKGVSAPLRAYELQGVGTSRTRLDISRARGFSKFAGRHAEMAALEEALQRALAAQGRVVGVVADAGTGKSRLCEEFVQACRARGILVRTATGVAHGKAVPLLPVLQFYRAIFGIAERDDERTARQKIAGAVVGLDEALLPALPLLYDFLGVPDPERPPAVPPGPERQRQLLATLKRLTIARGQREPAVLLFEDLHWLDPLTETFVENLVDAVDGSRTLMLVNFRPEYRAEWMRRSYYQQLALAPLDVRAFAEMFAGQLGADASLGDSSLSDLVARLHARTAGNPFFAEEIMQSLIETGRLSGAPGAYHLATQLQPLELPSTVHAVLAARIDRLGERDKAALQTAAVIGKDFGEPLLRSVAQVEHADLAAALQALIAGEFVYETALYPESEYSFKHPLTQEVAYTSQLRERRGRIHAAVARALETQHAGTLDEQAALIAHHWEGAGEALEAARWHARAAEFVGLRDAAEVLQRWRHVRELLQPLPETAEVIELRATAAARIVFTGARVGLAEAEMEEHFRDGIELARRSANACATVLLLTGRGFYWWARGDTEQARVSLSKAMAAAEDAGDLSLKLVAGVIFSNASIGTLRESLAMADRLIADTRGDPRAGAELTGYSPLVMLYTNKAMVLMLLGRLREAEEAKSQARALLAQLDDPVTEANLWSALSLLTMARGDAPGAVREALRGVEIVDRTTSTFQRLTARVSLLRAHVANSDWEAARSVNAEVQAVAQGSPFAHGRFIAFRPAIALGLGENEDALRSADEGLSQTLRPVDEVLARLTRAQALLRLRGAAARADVEAELQRVLDFIAEHGVELFRPQLHEVRAELARVLGDETAHTHELGEAHRLYTAMGATGHAERLRQR